MRKPLLLRLRNLIANRLFGSEGVGNEFVTNPFKSQAQRAACYAKGDPAWDCDEWNDKTDSKKLPKEKGTNNMDLLNDNQLESIKLWHKLGEQLLSNANPEGHNQYTSGGGSLKDAIHSHLKDNPRTELADLRDKFGGGKKVNPKDPLSHPVHKALKELRDEGKVQVHGGDFGEPSFSANAHPHQTRHPETGHYQPVKGASNKEVHRFVKKGAGVNDKKDDEETDYHDPANLAKHSSNADKDEGVNNAWSDEARQAALAARQASHQANEASTNSHPVAQRAARRAYESSEDAIKHGGKELGAEAHKYSAEQHEKAASKHRENGEEKSAKLHDVAAALHKDAYAEYKDSGHTSNAGNFRSEAQRKYMWSQEPELAEAWAHGEHTSDEDHKMPEGPGSDVAGPMAEKARERKEKREKTNNANPEGHNQYTGGGGDKKDAYIVKGFKAAKDYLGSNKDVTHDELHEALKDSGIHPKDTQWVTEHLYDKGLLQAGKGETVELAPSPKDEHVKAVKDYLKDYGSATGRELQEHLKDQGAGKSEAAHAVRWMHHSGQLSKPREGNEGKEYKPTSNKLYAELFDSQPSVLPPELRAEKVTVNGKNRWLVCNRSYPTNAASMEEGGQLSDHARLASERAIALSAGAAEDEKFQASSKAHKDAADAHMKAAEGADDYSMKQHHENMAAYHKDKAEQHRVMGGDTKKPYKRQGNEDTPQTTKQAIGNAESNTDGRNLWDPERRVDDEDGDIDALGEQLSDDHQKDNEYPGDYRTGPQAKVSPAGTKGSSTFNAFPPNFKKATASKDAEGDTADAPTDKTADTPADDTTDPHDASKEAASLTVKTGYPQAKSKALSALDHSGDENSEDAADAHTQAADMHADAAQSAKDSGDADKAKDHNVASLAHRKAAQLHSAAFTTNTKVDKGFICNDGFETDEQRQAFFGLLAKHKSGDSKNTDAQEKSAAANEKSKSANKGSRASGHSRAADLHMEAAKAHEEAGNKYMGDSHRKAAAEHMMKARKATRNMITSNWSDEARAAAIEARKAGASSKGMRGPSKQVQDRAYNASKEAHEASQDAGRASKEDKSMAHTQAADLHERAAKFHTEAGNDAAATAHTKAAEAHSKMTFNNQLTDNYEDEPMDRNQALAILTANCACKSDELALQALSDPALIKMARNAKLDSSNADTYGGGSDYLEAGREGYKKKRTTGTTEDDDPVSTDDEGDLDSEGRIADVGDQKVKSKPSIGIGKGAGRSTQNRRAAVANWLRKTDAPPEVVEAIGHYEREKFTVNHRMVSDMVSNILDPRERKAKGDYLMGIGERDPAQLKTHYEIWKLGRPVTFNQQQINPWDLAPSYMGSGHVPLDYGGPTANKDPEFVDNDESTVLALPRMNFEGIASDALMKHREAQ